MNKEENIFKPGFLGQQVPGVRTAVEHSVPQVRSDNRWTGRVGTGTALFLALSLYAATPSLTSLANDMVSSLGHSTPISEASHIGGVDAQGQSDVASWDAYLDSLETTGEIDPGLILSTKKLWELLRTLTGKLLHTPAAGPTDEGTMVLAWDNNEHHVDVDVGLDGCYEWFYSNRLTGSYDGDEAIQVDVVPELLREKIELLI